MTLFQSKLKTISKQFIVDLFLIKTIFMLGLLAFLFCCLYNFQQKMSLSTENINQLKQEDRNYKDNFESGCSWLARKAAFLHTLRYLWHIKDKVNKLEKATPLSINDLKQIRREDNSAYFGKLLGEEMQEILEGKSQRQSLEDRDIFSIVLATYKDQLVRIVGFYIMDIVFRLTFSVILFNLFQAVASNLTTTAYIYTGVLTILWYLSQLCRQHGYFETNLLAAQIKSGLSILLYAKISQLTSYSLNTSNLGTITNLIATDLGVIEQRLMNLTIGLSFPFMLIGVTIILVIRIGWIGVPVVAISALLVLISNVISNKSTSMVKNINKNKDKRVVLTTELIEGIKYVKLYGWELAFRNIIVNIRDQELSSFRKLAIYRAFERSLGDSINFICPLAVIVLGIYFQTGLTFIQIFSALQILTALKIHMQALVIGIGVYYQVKVSFQRFAKVFSMKNKSMIRINSQDTFQSQPSNVKQGNIIFHNFSGYWKEGFEVTALKNITYHFQTKKIYGMTGKVGSGKSGFIGAILHEIPYYKGRLDIKGSIALFQQEPFIFSDTVRNNILFGKKYDKGTYDEAVKMACLTTDFRLLTHGDQTVVGQKGVTLSGGQKARVALARCIYADTDILLLDDPLSAVDSKVARQIFQKCLKPLSRRKTIILATHQINFLYECDQVLIIDDGAITSHGNPQQMQTKLQKLSQSYKKEQSDQNDKESQSSMIKRFRSPQLSQFSAPSSMIDSRVNNQNQNKSKFNNRFIQNQSSVTSSTYCRFFFNNKYNYLLVPLVLILFILGQIIRAIFYRMLAFFDDVQKGNNYYFGGNINQYQNVLILLVLAMFVTLVTRYFILNLAVLMASGYLHSKALEAILHSPSSFFDATPSGILLNKFSNDLSLIDHSLIYFLVDTIQGPVTILIAVLNLSQININFILPSFIFMIIAILFFIYVRTAIIKCRQIDLQTKNPLFNFFAETCNGVTLIRIFKKVQQRMQDFSHLVNNSTKATFSYEIVSRAFGVNEYFLTIIYMSVAMIIGVATLTFTNKDLFGVTIIYLITINQIFMYMLRQSFGVQNIMVSAERMLQLQHLQRQKQFRTDYDSEVGLAQQIKAANNDQDLHLQWPQIPSLEFKNVSAKYDKHLPLILNNLSFKINQGQKIGVVGRTGAGKSSIIQVLFRLIEPQEGSTYRIDRCDALQMGLHSLRKHISVIPQTPFLFKGTIRQNLDPFDKYSDQVLWNVLSESGLKDHIQSLKEQMRTDISESQDCFSVGQKQLLCLARALLSQNRLLVLDEATSNVDNKTDDFIQRIIRQRFRTTTVITIAHRLSTIADYDRIFVMDKGRIVEDGSPLELFNRKGLFYSMVGNTGKNARQIQKKIKNKQRQR